MSERLVEAKVFIVDMACDVDGCSGKMVPDGRALLTYPAQYPHQCDRCLRRENYAHMYPMTRTVPIPQSKENQQ